MLGMKQTRVPVKQDDRICCQVSSIAVSLLCGHPWRIENEAVLFTDGVIIQSTQDIKYLRISAISLQRVFCTRISMSNASYKGEFTIHPNSYNSP